MKKFVTYNKKTGRVVSISNKVNQVDSKRFTVKEVEINKQDLIGNPIIQYKRGGNLQFFKNPLQEKNESQKLLYENLEKIKKGITSPEEDKQILINILEQLTK